MPKQDAELEEILIKYWREDFDSDNLNGNGIEKAKAALKLWRDKSVNEAIEEMFDEIVALASTKTFNNWTNKDASNFFFALGKYIREHKAHLNKKEDSHEHIYRNGIDNKGEYSVCECGHKIYKKGKE